MNYEDLSLCFLVTASNKWAINPAELFRGFTYPTVVEKIKFYLLPFIPPSQDYPEGPSRRKEYLF